MEPDGPTIPITASPWRELDPGTFRIVLADDHENIRTVLEKALRNEGYRVDTVADGMELLETARNEPPDLIVLDVMMPRMDGLETLSQLRQEAELAATYVILLTARSSLEEKVEGLDCGADDYLTKPFQLAELMARVRAGIRLRAMSRILEESQQLVIRNEKLATVGQLASGIAHEFNNIMSAISGFAQLARSNEKFQGRLAEVALEQAQRAQRITASLSSFASSGSAELRRTPVDHLIDSSVCLVQKELAQREIELTVEIPEDLPPIPMDPPQLQQVLVHLLLNAGHALHKGGNIALRVQQHGEELWIEVDDDGPGVPAEHRAQVFDPFFTTKGALGGADEPGTGLGLSFSQNIARRHEGKLSVAGSRLGGACFQLALPLGVLDDDPAEESMELQGSGTADGARIVLVEDDMVQQEVVCEVLESLPIIFSDGAKAAGYCQRHPVDVVILDLHLEGSWNGVQVLQELDKLETPPPVILTTGAVDPPDLSDIATPVIQILLKPYRLSELEAALAEALSNAH